MANTKNTAKTYTEAELKAMIAAAIAERDEQAKKTREAAKNAASIPNVCHDIPVTEKDTENNVLARCLFVVPGVGKLTGTACMVCHDGKYLPRFGLAVNAIFGIPGDTATDAEKLIDAVNAKAKHAPIMLATLAKAYNATSKTHEFRRRKGKAE
jgi:hypothetical protein